MFQRPLNLKWKLRWSIFTLFVLAIGISSLAIISFSYVRNYRAILDLSISRMQIVGDVTLGTINAATARITLIANLADGLITTEEDISKNSSHVISWLLNAQESAPLIESIRIGTKNGNLIAVSDLTQTGEEKGVPDTAKYLVQIQDRTGATPKETLEYVDANGTILQKKELPGTPLDPRTQSWYSIVATWPRLRWVSEYSTFQKRVIAELSLPLFDPSDNVIAVISIAISLHELANAISYQKVGKTGEVYIVSEAGQTIIPDNPAEIDTRLLNEAETHFRETGEPNFRIKKDGITWLINCSWLPLEYETDWLIITTVPFSDFFGAIVDIQDETIIISLSILCVFAILSHFIARHISSPIAKVAEHSNRLQRLDFKKEDPIRSHVSEIVTLTSSFEAMHNALSSFARYVPREVITALIEHRQEIDLGGQRGELTILFTDIENFTTIAEILPIEALLKALSEYFEAYSKIIVDSEGTIDKYMGDSIMALWNAPTPVEDSCSKACLAALRCLKFPKDQSRENPFLNGHTRFGIHDGEVIFGNIGTTERMCYTAIGNTVNTAERLQSLNKEYKTSILISETVLERIGSDFVTRPLDFVHVKGRQRRITVYELVGLKKGPEELRASPEEIELCSEFTLAYGHFHEGRMEEALQQFIALNQKFPSDYPTKIYLDKARAVLKSDS